MVVFHKFLLRPFTVGIDKPPSKYFVVAITILSQVQPPFLFGVGKWSCG
jgi:hypothetical protein